MDLSWIVNIPASTTQEHAPLSADLAEAPNLEILVVAGHPGYRCRRTPTGDAVAGLVEEVARLRAERDGHEGRANTYDAELRAVVRVLEEADHVRAGKDPAGAVLALVGERNEAQYEADEARDNSSILLRERDTARAEVAELRLTLAAEQGKPEGAPPGWEYCVISEDGDRGWRKPTADGMLFAWGAGVEFIGQEQAATPHPGGWARWVADEDGDLDEQIEWHSSDDWTARAAMLAADAATGAR